MKTIGDRIGSACKKSGLSQKELAEKLDWDQARLSRVISGNRKVSAGEIAEIATILDVSLDWLVTGSDPYWVSKKEVAARHDWDEKAKKYRFNPADLDVFRSVALVYKQAYR